MTLRHAALFACLLILATAAGFCDDATMGRYGPLQMGYTSEKLDPPLILNWEFTSSRDHGNSASPVAADGVCYFASGDRIYAVDMVNGNLKWKYPVDVPLTSSVKATPAIIDGKLYFGTNDGKLYCLNAATGSFEWFFETRGSLRCPPVVLDDIMYLGSDDNSIYTIHASSGDIGWSKPFTARDDFANGVAVGAGMVVGTCMDGVMYGVNANSGKPKWMFRLPNAPVKTSPIMTESQTIATVGNMVFGVTTRSGQQKWAIQLPSEASATPATDGMNIFVPCHDKKLYCYNISGRQPVLKWTEPADVGGIPMSSPTVADQLVYVTGSHGVVSAFSVDDGTLKWRYSFTASAVTTPGSLYTDASTSPIVSNGSLLILTDDGVLHCFTKGAPDTVPPDAFFVTPTNGIRMSGAPPIKFSAVLYDIGSGVDFASASMLLDGNPVELDTDLPTGTVSYTTTVSNEKTVVKPLSDGVHIITLTVKDYAGNKLTKEWSFIADSTLPPPRRSAAQSTIGKKTKDPSKDRKQKNKNNDNNNNSNNNDNSNNNNNNNGNYSGATPPMPPPEMPGGPNDSNGQQNNNWGRRNQGDQPMPGQ